MFQFLVLLLTLVLGQNDEDEARAAIAIAQAQATYSKPAPKVEPVKPVPPKPKIVTLPNDGHAYIVFVGMDEYDIGAYRIFRDDSAYERPGIYYTFNGSTFYRIRDEKRPLIEIDATKREVSQRADPFDKYNKRRSAAPTADDSPWLSVGEQDRLMQMWPKNVSNEGMTFYRQTNKSQRIAITNNSPSLQWYDLNRHEVWGNAPTDPNPNVSKPHWRVPGGLADVDGWQSYTAAYLPESPKVWSQPLPIKNGGMIPGYLWEYPDGTVFSDLLVKGGKAFELRLRTKNQGQWDSFVAYKDGNAAPGGYHGAGKRCAECHDSGPGSSEQYGILVRGADGCFSFNPFDFAER